MVIHILKPSLETILGERTICFEEPASYHYFQTQKLSDTQFEHLMLEATSTALSHSRQQHAKKSDPNSRKGLLSWIQSRPKGSIQHNSLLTGLPISFPETYVDPRHLSLVNLAECPHTSSNAHPDKQIDAIPSPSMSAPAVTATIVPVNHDDVIKGTINSSTLHGEKHPRRSPDDRTESASTKAAHSVIQSEDGKHAGDQAEDIMEEILNDSTPRATQDVIFADVTGEQVMDEISFRKTPSPPNQESIRPTKNDKRKGKATDLEPAGANALVVAHTHATVKSMTPQGGDSTTADTKTEKTTTEASAEPTEPIKQWFWRSTDIEVLGPVFSNDRKRKAREMENGHVFPKTICLDAHHIHVVRPTAYSFWPDQDVSAHIKTEDKARTSRGEISQITSNDEYRRRLGYLKLEYEMEERTLNDQEEYAMRQLQFEYVIQREELAEAYRRDMDLLQSAWDSQ